MPGIDDSRGRFGDPLDWRHPTIRNSWAGRGQRYWPVLATVLIDLPGSVPSLVLMRVRM